MLRHTTHPKTARICSALALFSLPLAAPAAFELVNDFENELGVTVWSKNPFGNGTVEVIEDPVHGGGNYVIAVNAGTIENSNTRVLTPIPTIEDGTVGTVFFRFALDESETNASGFFGVSPLDPPLDPSVDQTTLGFGHNKAHINVANNGSELHYRNGDTAPTVVSNRASLVWYKVWIVLDSEANKSSFYIQGGRFPEQTLVAEDFAFRNNVPGGEDLNSFFFMANAGGAQPTFNGMFLVDDIYVDTTGANLNDPVPTAAPAPAFTLVSNFNGVAGEYAWKENPWGEGSVEVVDDPYPTNNVFNRVLAVSAGEVNTSNLRVVTPIPMIADGSFGTVFLRFAVDSSEAGVNGTIALSPLEEPDGWNNNNVLLIFTAEGGLQYRDGGGATHIVANGEREDLTWYKAWFLIDNQTKVSSLYLQGGPLSEPTLVAEDFAFRKDAPVQGHDDLITLFFMLYSGNADPAPNLGGTLFIDDIYVDHASLNLSDPAAAADNATPNPVLGIFRATGPIELNGERDAAYSPRGARIGRFQGRVDSAEDLSATLYGAWNDDGLFLFVDIVDDELGFGAPASSPWNNDSLELFFDPGQNRRGSFDNFNDFKVVVYPQEDGTAEIMVAGFPSPPSGVDFSGIAGAVALGETGWTAEVFIPWDALQFYPDRDWNIGLGLQINDNDGDGRDGYLLWSGGPRNQALNFNTQNNGELKIWVPKKAVVSRTNANITINGERDSAYNDAIVQQTDGRWAGSGTFPSDTSVNWRALYDNENLYLFFEIADSALVYVETNNAWQNDSLELFLDGNNSKSGSFDNFDDVKIVFNPRFDEENTMQIQTTTAFPAPPPGTDFSGLEAAYVVTDNGWNLEVKVPWSIIKVRPVPGHSFGIDFALNDNDSGATVRDGTLTWSGGVGFNFATNRMGTATLFYTPATEVAPTTEAIVLDARIDDAYLDAPWNEIRRTNGGRFVPPTNVTGGYWTGVYDDEFLYLIVDVIDRHISVDSPTQTWNDDGLELFFDPSNNSSGNFDGREDFKITAVPILGGNTVNLVTTTNFPSPPAGTNFEGLEAAWRPTALGWRMEFKIPFHTLRIESLAGWEMGFDIMLNDDDFGGPRNHFLTWSGYLAQNFNTQGYGTVFLGGEGLFTTRVRAALVEGETWNSPWFGEFILPAAHPGFIYHKSLGWLYSEDPQPAGPWIWFYSYLFESWVLTNSSLFPVLFIDDLGWVYYLRNGVGSVFIYDFTSETWMEVP